MNPLTIEKILSNYKVSRYNVINSTFEKFINRRIKRIFVINLADNIIRRNYILVLMKKYNINFSLIIVNRIDETIYSLVANTKITKDELGCTLSHMWCLREIIKDNLENSIIFEDDIIFHKNFKQLFMQIFEDDYDFLLLGACDFSFQSLNKEMLYIDDMQEKTNNKHRYKNMYMYRPHENSIKLYGAHANYYSLEGAKTMYENKIKNMSFFDKDYILMFNKFKKSSFICFPNLVVSDISSSNLNHTYPFFSKSEELYYANCFENFKFIDYNFIYLDIILKNKGIKIKQDDTYESYMTRLIKHNFATSKERDTIKNRIVLDFFTINDLQNIKLRI